MLYYNPIPAKSEECEGVVGSVGVSEFTLLTNLIKRVPLRICSNNPKITYKMHNRYNLELISGFSEDHIELFFKCLFFERFFSIDIIYLCIYFLVTFQP